MNALPYPTPTRLRLAEAIIAGQIRHYHFVSPWTCDTVTDNKVTSRVAELVAAGLAAIPEPEPSDNKSAVRLTDAGAAWYARATKPGPGSTSPEVPTQ